jgi:hypothetical protein
LLIGINSYKTAHLDFPRLRGAVRDALDFKQYLNIRLRVPSNQIVLLTDESATRFNIIRALNGLMEDKRIIRDDPILVYYAGHGAEIDPPKYREHETGLKIQSIVPYDCDVYDEWGEGVPPIPDYVLGILLSKIADMKGNNIVSYYICDNGASRVTALKLVILDCHFRLLLFCFGYERRHL